ncbi:hypothetical protein [Sporosarcina psychrophila]|uniref:Diphthamide synthase (EF-2-diphthine--ammonia ligase) n=1 Tax=Sporosarcina psychrophila TaxID=1476 RepID=A0ABV2KAP5_SPOPS
MTQIMKASDIKELTELGKSEFETNVLEGPMFKHVVSSIEEAASNGYSAWSINNVPFEDIRGLKIIQTELQEAGYGCEINMKNEFNVFGMKFATRKFKVSW